MNASKINGAELETKIANWLDSLDEIKKQLNEYRITDIPENLIDDYPCMEILCSYQGKINHAEFQIKQAETALEDLYDIVRTYF